MPSWWEGFKNAGTQAYDTVTSVEGGNAFGNALIGAGVGAATSAVMDKVGLGTSANIPNIGYQGGIPSYEVVRDRVDTDPNRRRGGENQRYFTDTQYAKKPGDFKGTTPPSIAEAQARAATQRSQLQQRNLPPQAMAMGGIASMNQGYYLGGSTDGMADLVPASIDGTQEARLSDGEFVIPADVVSHLGNGNSDAGAKQLHGMMDTVRKARTGNPEQGKQIDPNKFMPKMAQGGIMNLQNGGSVYKNAKPATNFNDNSEVVSTVATPAAYIDSIPQGAVGKESSLSNYVGPYVTDMLGKGAALAETPYQEFQGPLTAGASNLQQQSFTGIGNLQTPTNMGVNQFDATAAQQYMNPYLMASINPQIDQARRQAEIQRVADAGRLTKAGAFGGSRQALMEAEGNRALGDRIADITGQGYASAYDRGLAQFNTEQDKRNQFGFDVLGGQATAGAVQRSIEQQGIGADIAQFEEERDFPYKQVQYMQSLLQGLPLEAQSVTYSEPSDFAQLMANVGGAETLGSIFGFGDSYEDIITASGGESTAINDAASQVVTDPETYGNTA
jgi:hypothetical protein